MTTTPTLIDSHMPLAEFLETHKAGITEAVTQAYPPLVTQAEPIPGLLRKPLGKQDLAITATARSLLEHRNTLLVGEMGVGKCVAPETLVTVNGEVQSIEEVWHRYAQEALYDGEGYIAIPSEALLVPSLTETDGKMKLRPVGKLWRQRVNESIRLVKLADGRTIRATQAHPFLTPDGWKNSIEAGQYVAIPATEPIASDVQPSPICSSLMGWLVAEGYEGVYPRSKAAGYLTLCQKNPEPLHRLVSSARALGMTGVKVFKQKGRSTWTLRATVTPVAVRLTELGYIWGSRSAQKRVPPFVMKADKASARTFLRAFMSGESSVNSALSVIETMTASERLAHEVVTLLRRFGVYARVRPKSACATNGSRIVRDYYRISVSGDDARRFAKEIGFEDATKQRRADLISDIASNSNLKTVYVGDIIPEAKRLTGLTRLSSNNLFGHVRVSGKQPTVNMATAKKLLDLLEHHYQPELAPYVELLKGRIESETFFVKVEEVTKQPYEGWVYDLEVPGTHNFVANHILVHNTTVGIASAYKAGLQRVLVMAPPHLVEKWAREVHETIPGVRTRILESMSQVESLRFEVGTGPLFAILSREKAKLSHSWGPAYVERKRYVTGEGRPYAYTVPSCPGCGVVLETEEGLLTHDELAKKKHTCSGCGEHLWQGEPVPRRFALAHYIVKRLPEFFDLFVIDECFPGNTEVMTPDGPVPIRNLRPGDTVQSWKDDRLVERRVTRTIKKRLQNRLVRITHEHGSFVCTPNHNIYTQQGYVAASELEKSDELITLDRGVNADYQQDMSGVRGDVRVLATPSTRRENMQPNLRRTTEVERSQSAATEGYFASVNVRALWQVISQSKAYASVLLILLLNARTLGRPGLRGEDPPEDEEQREPTPNRLGADETPQQRSECPGKIHSYQEGTVVLRHAGRERAVDARATHFAEGPWLACRVSDHNGQPFVEVRDGRSCLPEAEDRSGMRRRFSPHQEAEEPRCPQESDARGARLDGVEILEQRNLRKNGFSTCKNTRSSRSQVRSVEPITTEDTWVYDLEVEDTHCYFADGVLVSNCHEMKAGGSGQGIAAGALAATIPRTLGLTGTLFGGYSSNLFYLLQRFSPEIRSSYGYKEESRFVEHYGVMERTTREDADGEDGRVSKRRKTATIRERPGLSPALLPHLLFNTVFLRLADVAENLPSYVEEIEILRMEGEQYDVHQAFKDELTAELERQLACGSKKLLGAYVQSLLHHPDTPWREEAVYSPDEEGVPRLVAHAEALDDSVVYPKEQRLIDIALAEKRRGRRMMVFVQGTDRRDITGRLKTLLERNGLKTAVLKSKTVSAKKREAWIEREAENGVDVIICHPRIVQTGLDLIAFPTLMFYQVEYSVYTLRQASRRSWRIGQERPVKVIHLAYEETVQVQALKLIAKKAQASLALEGELVEGGLVGMADEDLMLSLAKSLVSGDDDSPITDLSSALGDEDDFITDLPPRELSILEALEDLFGSPTQDSVPVYALDDVRKPEPARPVATLTFTDAPVLLGEKGGGRRKKVSAGVGLLFPEMMGA